MNEFFYDSCTLILKFSIPGIFLAMVYDIFRLIRIGRNDLNHKPIVENGLFEDECEELMKDFFKKLRSR
jgi:hypothetical protein